jgi:hypothetical protein
MSSEIKFVPPIPPINNTSLINQSVLENSHTVNQIKNEFVPGQFLYIKSDTYREMLQNAWTAITQLELWDYMKRDTESYMLSCDKEIDIITKKMETLGYDGHSGSSFGWTLRQMQYIAQYGESNYMDSYLTNN